MKIVLPLWAYRLIDRLLTLLPGSASNPDSLEARVRRMHNGTKAVYDAAIIKMNKADEADLAVEKEVSEKAALAVKANARAIEVIQQRTVRLNDLI